MEAELVYARYIQENLSEEQGEAERSRVAEHRARATEEKGSLRAQK